MIRAASRGSAPRCGVDRRRGVVEHEDARVGEHRPGDRDALALAARQREALLADHRVVAVGQLDDELVRAGGAGRGLDLGVGGVGPAVGDVGAHGVGEEERVLEHDADLRAQRVERDVAHVDAVDADRPGLHVVEAGEQQAHGRLARARRADERDGLAGRDAQREVASTGSELQVAEVDVRRSATSPATSAGRRASGFSCTSGFESSSSKMRSAPARACWATARMPAIMPDRREQLHEVGGEGEERAERDLAVDREPAAEREHADLTERRDRLQRRLVPGLDPHGAHPRRYRLSAGRRGVELAVLLAEALHDAHAGDGFVDDAGDLAGLLQRVPAARGTSSCAAAATTNSSAGTRRASPA